MRGLNQMKARMNYDGGNTSDDRVNKSKYLSFQAALNNSYQAETITFNDKKYRCLINPDKISIDYDQKIISIDFSAGMKNGDVFYWDRTGKYWIVFLQRYEEEAYFRATIRECDYKIDKWWCYTRGPVETSLTWRQKHDIQFNDMNLSILLYVTNNSETNEYFSRFKIVKFDNHNWRVAAVDRYSQPGLLEVYLEEWHDNDTEEMQLPDKIDKVNISEIYIDGPQFIKPYDTDITFTIVNKQTDGYFSIDNKKIEIIDSNIDYCTINVNTGKSTKFKIYYKDNNDYVLSEREVTVKSF